jgi:23S rRNA pseudouridine1911/1915/1917 synthase
MLDHVRSSYPSAGVVHRLDRPVSGAMLFARTVQALDPCHAMFRGHRVRKTYWAIVEGTVQAEGIWRHRIREDGRSRRARLSSEEEVRSVELGVRILALGDRYSLVELRPREGRFHQLRAQCAAAGHPIKGDVKYGARRGEPDRSIGLHARSLEFDHPITGRHLQVVAPPPAKRIWEQLGPR